MSWHFFLLNLGDKPITIHKYMRIQEERNALAVKKVVGSIVYLCPCKM